MSRSGGLWLAIDSGTTLTKAILFDGDMRVVAERSEPVPVTTPRPGWVEFDAAALVRSVRSAATSVLSDPDRSGRPVVGLGLSNQGETVVAWDGVTGEALAPAVVWQDRRTQNWCDVLEGDAHARALVAGTGLRIDPYFSASKFRWLLRESPAVRSVPPERLRLTTTDAFLLWHLTEGRNWSTDVTTASRTSLVLLEGDDWDPDLCALFEVPPESLPVILPNVAERGVARLHGEAIPVLAAAVDQQAALWGHGAVTRGDVKITYGTGAFVLGQLGKDHPTSAGLLTTVAWDLGSGRHYAYDGGVFTAGAAIEWAIRAGILSTAQESSELARSAGSDPVVFVPALQGLAAPYWEGGARGTLLGLTLSTGRAEIVRAILDGIAFRVADVVQAMTAGGLPLRRVRVDGGPSKNDYLMQRQADLIGVPIEVADVQDSAALGVALMAQREDGGERPPSFSRARAVFSPGIPASQRDELLDRWRDAIHLARLWRTPTA